MKKRYKQYLEKFEPNIQCVILDNGAYSVMNSNLGIAALKRLARFTVYTRGR